MQLSRFITPFFSILFWCVSIIWVFFFGFMIGQSQISKKDVPFLDSFLQTPSSNTPISEKELNYYAILQQPNEPIVVPNDADVVEKNKPQAPPAPQMPPQTNSQNTTSVFRFSLQLLAVQQKRSAEDYVEKLKKENIPTTIIETSKNNIVWYRVYTTFEGTVEAFNAFKDKLATLGILDTILREKTPL